MSSFILAYLAGVVTILSPCVLPLVPIVLGGAVSAHRFGPYALASGLVIAFTGFGLLIATAGFAVGLTPKLLNQIAAVLMIAAGLILMSHALQERFALAAATATGALNSRVATFTPDGLSGQFALGALLGAVWTPCVGPTLGAAIALASSGEAVGYAALVMLAFAVGTVTPLLGLMLVSRDALHRNKGSLVTAAKYLKPGLGALLVLTGVLFLSGLMSAWEAFILDRLPDGMLRLIYSI
jgi:cytochrome c-type biogenesis protein